MKGLRLYKQMLKRADKRRKKAALCKVIQDERRAYAANRYDPWAWD